MLAVRPTEVLSLLHRVFSITPRQWIELTMFVSFNTYS